MSHFLSRNHCPRLYDADIIPPVPDNLPPGQKGEFIRSFDDQLWLFQRSWIPEKQIVATLMILHGTVDHSGVYHELAVELNKAGIAVFCCDMRGWGLSDGEAYYFHDVNTFVLDVEAQYTRIHEEFKDVTHRFLLGKSIGGLLAAYTCCSSTVHFDGLIGLSGAFAVDKIMVPSTPVLALLSSLNVVMPKLPLKPLMASSMLVSDETAALEWEADPLVHRERLTVGYISELLRCSNELEDILRQSQDAFPSMLMLWGTDDAIVTLEGHELMCRYSKIASLKTYSGGRHNLLAEPEHKTQVITDIRDYILVNCK